MSCKVPLIVVEWRLDERPLWAFSSDGRAPASHVGGRGIDTSNVQFLLLLPTLLATSHLLPFALPIPCYSHNITPPHTDHASRIRTSLPQQLQRSKHRHLLQRLRARQQSDNPDSRPGFFSTPRRAFQPQAYVRPNSHPLSPFCPARLPLVNRPA